MEDPRRRSVFDVRPEKIRAVVTGAFYIDGLDAAFQHGDRDDAVDHVLLWRIGSGEEIAVLTVQRGDAFGDGLDVRQRHGAASARGAATG